MPESKGHMIAQIDPEIAKLIPSKWTPYVIGSILALPYLTRAWHGWQQSGGLRGIWSGVMNGTNVPKQVTGGSGQPPDANKP
jgi:hypothetical protein